MKLVYGILIAAAVLILLYLLAIMPRLTHRKERKVFSGVYYAHRGLHDNHSNAPENSMAAFRKAVKKGYGIELDVQLTKDRIPVVFHDFTLDRMCKKSGKVCEYTWEEIKEMTLGESGETIPRLADVLNLVDGRVPLIIEYKVEWMDISVCTVAQALLKDYKGLYCIESFNPLVLLWYRRFGNDIVRGQLSDGFIRSGEYRGGLYFCLQNLLLNWVTKPDFIAYNCQYANNLSRRICWKLYRCMAVAWTIKSKEDLAKAQKAYDIVIFDSFIPNQG